MIYLYLALIIVFIKYSSNYFYKKQIIKYRKLHENWLKNGDDKFYLHQASIIALFKKANLPTHSIPIIQAKGYNHYVRTKIDSFNNFPSHIKDLLVVHLKYYDLAESVFHSRKNDAINPFYWINLIVFAPKKLLEYLNLNSDKISFKLLNISFTIIWWIVVILFTFFKQDLKVMIINLLEVYF